jgi:hypothetical protein
MRRRSRFPQEEEGVFSFFFPPQKQLLLIFLPLLLLLMALVCVCVCVCFSRVVRETRVTEMLQLQQLSRGRKKKAQQR